MMFVIVVYDVNSKRDQAMQKAISKYLFHVQNSVFEGNITEKQLCSLKDKISSIIDCEGDRVRIYKFGSLYHSEIENIGKCLAINNIYI